MSALVTENTFLSALQPNTAVTTYALPSDMQLGNGSAVSDEVARERRVQQQVKMRLAEKSTLPRQNGSAMSDYGGSSSVKYNTYNPASTGFSSKSSYIYSGSRTMGPRMSQKTGFSCRSAGPELAQMHRISVGTGGGGGGGFYREQMRIGGYQGTIKNQGHMDLETQSVHSMRPHLVNQWQMPMDNESLLSDHDATYTRQYSQSTTNGYTSQMRQGGSSIAYQPTMRRSLSGTLSRGGGGMTEEVYVQQQPSFKGPAHRTISRITNRNRMSMGSMSGTLQNQMTASASSFGRGGDTIDRGFISSGLSSASQGNLMMQRQGTLSRAMSIKSMQSVGKGIDVYPLDMGASMGNLSGITGLDMITAVQHLGEEDSNMQILGAAYIQHECYHDPDAKNEVRELKGIPVLVQLVKSDNQDVQRYATGAIRNLIYENMDNKVALIQADGINTLVSALNSESDDELYKNITGIMWNLSSKDNLKAKLARESLKELTEKVLTPLTLDPEITLSPSKTEIFQNTTGCLRNLSSVDDKTRENMRATGGLVESLISYIQSSINNSHVNDKGVENTVCVLRNLSYQLYAEMPPSVSRRLEGPTRDQGSGHGDAIGCFTPQSRKAKNNKNMALSTFSEVSRVPKGQEWLWHPEILKIYLRLLQDCDTNTTTREAAAGALQNITAGDYRWASVLSQMALEKERALPLLNELLRTKTGAELRSVTGLFRNLSRHAVDKTHMASKSISDLVSKLPDDAHQKEPHPDVVVNICGVLNNLVIASATAAKDITFFGGLKKLVDIKCSAQGGNSTQIKIGKAAATVLSNMYQYKKVHKQYKEKGYVKGDFVDPVI